MAKKRREEIEDFLPKKPKKDIPQSLDVWKAEQSEVIKLPVQRGPAKGKTPPQNKVPTARKFGLVPKTVPKKLPKAKKV
jgi:hypothetical protein